MKNVKLIGRTLEKEGIVWLGLSGTGIEFMFHGKRLETTLWGDSLIKKTDEKALRHRARIAVEINGKRTQSFCMTKQKKDLILWNSEKATTVCVKIIKLSEAAMSLVGIGPLKCEKGSTIQPTKEKEFRIEVIGDSITCGYGIDDPYPEHSFQTQTEDVTKAYAYLAAQKLEADYSLVSYSGYGILSGYTEQSVANTRETLPQYYEKVAHSDGQLPDGTCLDDIYWDFHQFKSDVIVINLGTNDDSFCRDYKDRQLQYAACYTKFIKEVRRLNATAEILCIYGLMGDRLYPFVEKAVEYYKEETKDVHIHCVHIRPHSENDGYSADTHPSVKSQKRLAEELYKEICKIMGKRE